ncbi:hypothetical protein TanjilG_17153 [Lupinus angustifolius]|uniref:Cupin type-1 domain-containing protein n=1 Tax=Lupinus angustifolius TaxID=3871 RepID=A0A4P1R0P6_LUPAN|nr:PREDICTED: vicilin-like seed storage protein At2g28490 [Lupinus angustifolius]OIV99343.1 hypothetical protein TanjilG_17153 [Lupinus angustifolius]
MANRNTLLLLLLVIIICNGVALTMGSVEYEERRTVKKERRTVRKERPSSSSESSLFLMHDSKSVVKTEAGEMIVKNYGGGILERRMHIGFITMEPKSLFIPQYLDSNLAIFIRRGEANLGVIYKNDLGERRLKAGDVYIIPAGSPFYLVNVWEGQRLHIICSIQSPQSFAADTFHSFYLGGRDSVLSGFRPEILEAAFNASRTEVRKIFSKEVEGPIVYVDDSHAPSLWTKFLELKKEDKVQHMKGMLQLEEEEEEEEEEEKQRSWSWRNVLETLLLGRERKHKGKGKGTGDSPDSVNLYDRKPDFRNNYGWSIALDGRDYAPLKTARIGIYHVNLTAGSMMAPHVNPLATEYGIVLSGSGRIQIVFPNGTSAMNTEIKQGDVFFVPRYFPFCQIASRNGPLEFFGFATSARRNRPQFLAGAASILRTMMGPELAAAFGVAEDTMRWVVDAQHEAVILPSPSAAPGDVDDKRMSMNVLDESV